MKNISYGEANETDIADLVQLLSLLFNIEKDFNPDTSKQQKGLELLLKSNATQQRLYKLPRTIQAK